MRIYITDSDGPLEENFEEISRKFADVFSGEEIDFSDADILPGASLTALLAEFRNELYIGIPLAVFFAGKTIEENIDAWHKILKRLVGLFTRLKTTTENVRVTIDNHGAALIAFNYVLDRYESTGFRLVRVLGINGLAEDVIDCQDEQIEERFVGSFMSYLCIFQLDHLLYLEVLVDSSGEILRSDPLIRNNSEGAHDEDGETSPSIS